MEENNDLETTSETPCENQMLSDEERREEPELNNLSFNFQTVPMDENSETLEDKVTKVLKSIDTLLERTADSEDTHAIYEDMVNFYNSFDSKTKLLIEKLDKEVSYTRFIETQISSKSIEKECLMLKKALVEERALMGVKLDEIKSAFEEKMGQIESESKLVQEKQVARLDEMAKLIQKFSDIDGKITEKLEGFRKDMTKASNNEFNIFQTQCKESLAAANSEFSTVKKNVIAFLKSCEKQNDTLIKKIPEQKRKFCWKDCVIYAMSGLCIVGMIVQIFV
ncbi:MAG: hypothetical protein Q4P16_08900 [Spirochaetales bacterium]|nr:hypothetical protein [Spirochaetales bacterium]